MLAGGQSLVPLLNMRLARPAVLVDINRVAGLDASRSRTTVVRVGALVRQAAFAPSAHPRTGAARVASASPTSATSSRATAARSAARSPTPTRVPSCRSPSPLPAASRDPLAGRRPPQRRRGEFFVTHFTTSSSRPSSSSRRAGRRPGPAPASRSRSSRCGDGDYALGMAACASGSRTAGPPTRGSGSARSATGRSCSPRSPRWWTAAVDPELAREAGRRGRRRRSGRRPPRVRRLPAAPDRPPRRAGARERAWPTSAARRRVIDARPDGQRAPLPRAGRAAAPALRLPAPHAAA